MLLHRIRIRMPFARRPGSFGGKQQNVHEIGILCSKMAMGHFVVSAQVCFRGVNIRDLLYIAWTSGLGLGRFFSVTWAVGGISWRGARVGPSCCPNCDDCLLVSGCKPGLV